MIRTFLQTFPYINPRWFTVCAGLSLIILSSVPLTGHLTSETGYLTTYVLTIPRYSTRWDLYLAHESAKHPSKSWVLIQTVYIQHPRSVHFSLWRMNDLSDTPHFSGTFEVEWNAESVQPLLRLQSSLRALLPLFIAHLWVPATPFPVEKIGPFLFQKYPLPGIPGFSPLRAPQYSIRLKSITHKFPSATYSLILVNEPIIRELHLAKTTYSLIRHWHGAELIELQEE